jgi:tetratricopeptide (TPR) repeat protein
MRYELSEAIESVRVPFRLEAEFRTNVASGDVALEVLATPFRAFPSSAYVAGLGVVPTTTEMRRREASKYAARIGLLLSAHAFKGSERIRRVWVSSVLETPTRRTCLFSGCVDRKTFCRLSLDRQTDPIATLRRLGVSLLEENGILKATDPTFYLEDPRFCPPMRHDLWRFSERALPASAAISLGASRVSGLVIHEELPRMLAADAILRNIADPSDRDATQRTVHAIMEVAGQTSDLTVWGAAERVVARLVDGTLGLDDLDGIRSEFVSGDVLTRKVESAERLIAHQRPQDALEVLLGVLQPIERAGSYDDSDAVAYRCFESFAERVIYNRLNAQDKRSVILAPDAYPMAHMLASALLASLSAQEQDGGSHAEQAVAHAKRAVEVAPLSTAAKLGLAACLEQAGDVQAAQDQIVELLESAYHPQAIGYAYYRMASVQWELGNDEACQACYLRSIRMEPTLLRLVIAKCQALMAQGATFVEQMDEDAVIEVLNKNGIPLAPTARTSYLLYDGATASVDAEVFPVARELMQVMESLTGDDVIRGIRKSLEREPDA